MCLFSNNTYWRSYLWPLKSYSIMFHWTDLNLKCAFQLFQDANCKLGTRINVSNPNHRNIKQLNFDPKQVNSCSKLSILLNWSKVWFWYIEYYFIMYFKPFLHFKKYTGFQNNLNRMMTFPLKGLWSQTTSVQHGWLP